MFDASDDDVEATRRQLLEPPPPWGSENGPERALAYVLRVEVDRALLSQGGADTERWFGGPAAAGATMHQRFEVLQGRARRRLRVVEGGPFVGLTQLADDHQGFAILDPTTRTFLQLTAGQLPGAGAGYRRATATVDIEGTEEVDGRATSVTTIVVDAADGPERVRWRIWSTRDEALQEYAADVLAVACGWVEHLDEEQRRQVIDLGVPLRGEATAVDDDLRGSGPAVTFRVSDLDLHTQTAGAFAIPPDFVDMRGAGAHAAAPYRYMGPYERSSPERHDTRHDPAATQMPADLDFDPHDLAMPSCVGATYGAALATRFEPRLLDDVKMILNEATKRLSRVRGEAGTLTFDSMTQLREYSNANNAPDGKPDGWYDLLHQDYDPTASTNGAGLLDRLAARGMHRLLEEGSISDLARLGLVPVLWLRVNNVYFGNPPGHRWEQLTAAERADITEAYYQKRLASFTATYPTSTPFAEALSGLVMWRLADLHFSADFGNRPLIDKLEFGYYGNLKLVVRVPEAKAKAIIERLPGPLWAVAVASTLFICMWMPVACVLLASIDAGAAFLALDLAPLQVELRDCSVNVEVSFGPNPAPSIAANPPGVLNVSTTVNVDAALEVFTMSPVPSGLHQIIDGIISIVASTSREALDAIGDQLRKILDEQLHDLLPTFPPKLEPIAPHFEATTADSDPKTGFQAGSWVSGDQLDWKAAAPFMTQVDPDVLGSLTTLPAPMTPALIPDSDVHHLGGFSVSQNLLNLLLHQQWRAHRFQATLTPTEAMALSTAIAAASDLDMRKATAEFWLAASPRFVVAESGDGGAPYAVLFFDDARICVRGRGVNVDHPGPVVEFKIAAKAPGQIGFGGLSGNKVSVLQPAQSFVSVYAFLSGLELVDPVTHAVAGGAGRGVAAALPALRPALKDAMALSLRPFDDAVVPVWPGRSVRYQRDMSMGLPITCVVNPVRGILHTQWGLDGLLVKDIPHYNLWNLIRDGFSTQEAALMRGFA